MGPAMTPEERGIQWPHLTPAQALELERWQRTRAHVLMEGQPIPSDPPPWPETPDAEP
jgi:hypothetical protein